MGKCRMGNYALQVIVLSSFMWSEIRSSDTPSDMHLPITGKYDVNDEILFNVRWPGQQPQFPNTEHQETRKNLKSVTISTARKEKYECFIPVVKEPKQKRNHDEEREINPYTLMKEGLADSNYTPCSYRLEHYWTYELCHGRYMRQYHEDRANAKVGGLSLLDRVRGSNICEELQVEPPLLQIERSQLQYFRHVIRIPEDRLDPKLQEYILGIFNKSELEQAENNYEKNRASFIPPTKRLEGKDFPYLVVNMTNGTICDLNQQPRRVRVMYICYEQGRNELYSFHEASTCEYEVVILSALLCKHPLFKLNSPEHNDIQCYSSDESPRVPRMLSVIDLESAKLRLPSNKPKLLFHGKEDVKSDSSPVLERPPAEKTEVRRARVPSTPPIDSKLINDFLSGDYCLSGGGTTWWKYRLCLGKKVEQYHKDRASGSETVVLLGNWDPVKNADWFKSKKLKSKVPHNEVHSLYADGDMCEEMKVARQVEVRLRCKEAKPGDHLSSVTMSLLEPVKCKYILRVESAIICSLIKDKGDDGHLP